ncbi:MAG: response regulator [Devosiaceae bacterium]
MTATILKNIHFIDDSIDEFLITRLLFRKEKIDINLKTYTGLAEFMEAASAMVPFDDPAAELIVTDMNLTIQSGVDVIKAIRSDPQLQGVVAGICSGSDDPADVRYAMEAGADFFVIKSLDKQALTSICDTVHHLALVQGEDGRHRLSASQRMN